MMVDWGATAEPGAVINVLPPKDNVQDGSYASGGLKSKDGRLSCGYSTFRGRRASMEDFFDVKLSEVNGQTVCLSGIFDGPGGSHTAEYLKEHLFDNLIKHPQFMSDTKLAICETNQRTDSDFLDAESNTLRDDGSTASTAVIVAIPLSDDHKPNRSDERKRIENAGGVVMWAETWRVGGILAMSHAFGNRLLKQFVIAEPEIQEQEVNDALEFLVLASDGLWDVVPIEDEISLARREEEVEVERERVYEGQCLADITCMHA